MKFEDLVKATGLRIVEGGPFMFEDFGASWVILWEDELTAVFTLEEQEVVFVECNDMDEKGNVYLWMNPKYAEYEKKIYDELADAKTHYCTDVQDVFNVWHKNQELYEDMPPEARMEMEDEKGFIQAIENGIEVVDNDEAEIH